MNAPVDHANAQATTLASAVPQQPQALPQELEISLMSVAPARRETAPVADSGICRIERRQLSYLPDQQVELLHLQAEAEALLLQLQTVHQRRAGRPDAALPDACLGQ
ncbi:MAG: hypothetical protein EA368_13950 [Leptolyngbya sp. DLM2.Bin27]|nr:MAG: hypothetical protein EA368_13950 [Leptolyngbya sp. DLM2.Bin27]